MMTIIEIEAVAGAAHGLQSQSHRKECWLDGWIEVPEELTETAWASGGYCHLTIEDGVLIGITKTERPPAPIPKPTQAEQMRADVDYLAAMAGVML